MFKPIERVFTDIAANVKNCFAPNKKPHAEGKVLSDGAVSHNVDLSVFEGTERKQAEHIVETQVRELHELAEKRNAAEARGDRELTSHYDGKIEEAQKRFDDIKFQLEHDDFDMTTLSALVTGGPITALGVMLLRGPDAADRIEDAAEISGADFSLEDTSAEGGSAAKSGRSGAAGEGGIWDGTPADWVSAFHDDPQAFFDQLKDLDPAERSAILMTVQQQIQQDNQLFSMLTNFQQAMHDTQKALISNLRV